MFTLAAKGSCAIGHDRTLLELEEGFPEHNLHNSFWAPICLI